MAARARRPRDDDDDEDDPPPKKRTRLKDDEDDAPRAKKRLPARKRAEEEEEDDEPEEEEQKLSRKQKQLAKVRLGILFHIIKLWIYMAALLFGFILMPIMLFVSVAVGGLLATLVSWLLWTTVYLAIIVAPLFGIVGCSLCYFIPPKSEARGTILVSLVLDVVAPLTAILALLLSLGFLFTEDDRIARLAQYMNMGSFASTLVAWWVFMIYLRKLGFYMRETLMASEALNIITHLIVATVLGPSLVIGTFVMFAVNPGLFTLIMFILCLVWLIYFIVTFPIRMFRMLFMMRRKIWEKYLKPDDDDDLLISAYGT